MQSEGRRESRKRVDSIRVRYCTATQNEFLETHSFDVSSGGTFVCTSSPLAPGTLLRLEIHLQQHVLHGVGRVVWKRDVPGGGRDAPAGMGVKFIKIDEVTRRAVSSLPKRSPLW